MLPGAPVLQPPRSALETGDASLATEVLPAPPTLSSVLQASGKRDPRKPVPTMTYLPQHDPGTTYAGVLTGPIVGSLESIPEVDGPRRKRVRLDKGSLSQLAQRGHSRGLNTPPQVLAGADALEHMAAGQLETDSQTNSWDPELVSRCSSVACPEDAPPGSKVIRTKEKGKGKTKEKDNDKMISRIKEEPLPVVLPLFNNLSSAVTAPLPPVRHDIHILLAKRGSLLGMSFFGILGVLRWLHSCLSPLVSRSADGGGRHSGGREQVVLPKL